MFGLIISGRETWDKKLSDHFLAHFGRQFLEISDLTIQRVTRDYEGPALHTVLGFNNVIFQIQFGFRHFLLNGKCNKTKTPYFESKNRTKLTNAYSAAVFYNFFEWSHNVERFCKPPLL